MLYGRYIYYVEKIEETKNSTCYLQQILDILAFSFIGIEIDWRIVSFFTV